MKKLLSVVLCALMIAALLPMNLHTAIAEDETSGQCGDTLYWSFSESTGKLTITGSGAMYDYTQMSGGRAPWYSYYGDIRSAELPSGLTRIGDNAFYNCVMLRTVTIPEGVTAIGAYAFMYCPLKENLVLPESLTSIGEHAFDAADIWYVTVPAAVASIGDGAFSDCINLREIRTDADNAYYTAVDGVLFNKVITELITYPAGRQQSSYSVPDGVRTIRPYACGCAPFTTLTFADTVAEIGEWAFFGCNSLKKVTFGNGVTTIGINAFRSCTSLETVFISRSVASIHTGAFPACGKLTAFTVDAENPYFASADGVILSKDRTRIVLFPTGKDGHYEVPAGVSCIGERAFYWNCTMSKLTSIYLPLSVTRVEYEAFGMGTPLNDVYYEGSQTDRQTLLTIGDHNTRLLNAEWHYDSAGSDPGLSGQCGDDLYWSFDEETGVLTITGSGAMYGYSIRTAPWDSVRSEITAVVFPDGMTSVGKSAFYGCTGIEEIVIPDSVTVINDGAFRGCTGVTSITAPCSVRVVTTNYTFSDCTAVTTVHITKGTGTMAAGPLPYVSGSGSVSVILDDGVRNISDKAFRNKRYLTAITIPSSVTDIADEAFYGCSGLTAITIPSSVTDIGDSAFYNCTGLEAIAIPSSVTSIGWGAFSGCTGLGSVTISNSVTCIADYMFYGCTNLLSVTIPSGVTSIGESAFEGCRNLLSVTIPSGVASIGDRAFTECAALTSIVLPDSVTSVGAQAFGSCSTLKNVTMPCSAEIGLSAFDDSGAIRKLRFTVGTGEWKISNKTSSPTFQGKKMTAVLDEGIPEIGEYGFYRCSGLTSITIPSSVTSIGDRAFYACTGLPEITILSHVTSIGKEAFRGCTGLRSASIDSGVIGESAFQECTGIESLTIGDAAESIGVSAFYGCTQLTSVGIGGGVTGIGNSAFGNCRALPAITIPDSVTSIGESAFYNCVQLASATIGDGVTDVGKNAFKECASLASITMPCSANIGQSAFSGCKAVTEVHLTKGTGTMTGYRPNTYEYTPWYVSRGNAMTVTLDEGILNIGSWVFYNCTGLTEITLPSSLVSIDAYAFNDCKGLTEITIPGNVTDIGTFAFSGCTYLTDVYYDGTPQMRRKITIQHSNTSLLDAEWHYLPVNAIEWKTLPKKLTYAAGEALSVYGGAITTYYDHDIVEEEPLTAEMVTGFDSSVFGKQTLTVTFGGKTLTYEIEVIAQIQIEGTVEWNAEDVQFKGSTPYVIANGSAQTPRFTVKNSADGSVVDPAYYDYEYRENTNAGTGYVIVTFKGAYSGTAQGWFKIYLPATEHTDVENVAEGIRITWDPVEGAAGYVIYRRAWSSTTNGWTDFVRWYNVTGTEWIDGSDVDHKVYAGSRYQYGVKAYFARRTDPVSGAAIGGNVGDNYNLGEVGPLKTTVRITTRKLVQVRPGSGTMTVKWEASKNFTGYQIKYATDANFTKNVVAFKIGDPTTYWTTIKGLKSNTTYYVCIRSYHEFNGMTYFGEWSNVLSGKVK